MRELMYAHCLGLSLKPGSVAQAHAIYQLQILPSLQQEAEFRGLLLLHRPLDYFSALTFWDAGIDPQQLGIQLLRFVAPFQRLLAASSAPQWVTVAGAGWSSGVQSLQLEHL